MKTISEFYPKAYYTPMPEMHNENIPVTAGCEFNLCRYCDLNGMQPFQIFPIENIKAYIRDRAAFYQGKRRVPQKFTLLEGNALCVDTEFLLAIMAEIHAHFAEVKYISSFARSQDIMDKSLADLKRLKAAGLDRLSIGIESGSTRVLHYQRKGVTAAKQLEALQKLEAAGIRYTCYIMIGLGGQEWSTEHALATADFLNQVHPDELTVVTMVLFKGAELVKDVREGKFKRLRVDETIREEKLLLENLTLDTLFNGTHPTNAVSIQGRIPQQKNRLIEKLDEVLANYQASELTNQEIEKWQDITIH